MKFDKSQEEFFSQIRHDLKNALSTVKMSTYILSKQVREKDFSEVEKHLTKIDKKVDELAALIDKKLKSS